MINSIQLRLITLHSITFIVNSSAFSARLYEQAMFGSVAWSRLEIGLIAFVKLRVRGLNRSVAEETRRNLSTSLKVKLILIFARKKVHCRVNSVIFCLVARAIFRLAFRFPFQVSSFVFPASFSLSCVCFTFYVCTIVFLSRRKCFCIHELGSCRKK